MSRRGRRRFDIVEPLILAIPPIVRLGHGPRRAPARAGVRFLYYTSSATLTLSAFASFRSRLNGGSCRPISKRDRYARLTPTFFASASCVIPRVSRSFLSLTANLSGDILLPHK